MSCREIVSQAESIRFAVFVVPAVLLIIVDEISAQAQSNQLFSVSTQFAASSFERPSYRTKNIGRVDLEILDTPHILHPILSIPYG